MALDKTDKLIITGAAGLVGQNLITELIKQEYTDIIAIDNDQHNLQILHKLHPEITCIQADLSQDGEWKNCFHGAKRLFLLQAQITGLNFEPFQKNTLESTARVIDATKKANIPFTVFIGSSVLHSVADDNYTRSKRMQTELMANSDLNYCTAHPTLMFGWFDPKHLGWLSRFMAKIPIFPIPGDGKFLRQPLYVLDFCRVLIWCAENEPTNKTFDIVGQEDVDYIDIIREIKRVKKLHTLILKLPVSFFRFLMNVYALFSKNPPFVADQLDALMAGDYFKGENIQEQFGITPTPFKDAINETFTHPKYSKVVLRRWS